jgi:hypothetical protein
MVVETARLWLITRGRPQVDPAELSSAIVEQIEANDLDYRSRLLIRDSLVALRDFWTPHRFSQWWDNCPVRAQIEEIAADSYDKVGFPSLRKRLRDKTPPRQVETLLRAIGACLREPCSFWVTGTAGLILHDRLQYGIDAITIVSELPEALARSRVPLEAFRAKYGLAVSSLPAHYLPPGWQERARPYAQYGKLRVWVTDPADAFVCKLFSNRIEDLCVLRIVDVDYYVVRGRFMECCGSFLETPNLRETAERNWQILFGESLPS